MSLSGQRRRAGFRRLVASCVFTSLSAAVLTLTYLSTDSGLGLYGQISALALLALESVLAGLWLGFRPVGVTRVEAALYLCSALSLLVAEFRQDWFLMASGATLVLALASISLLARCLELRTILNSSILTSYLLIGMTWATGAAEILADAGAGGGERWSHRLAPLGNHPDLAGLIFSGLVIPLLARFGRARAAERGLILGAAGGAVAIVLATGARGGLAALAASAALLIGETLVFDRGKRAFLLVALAVAGLVVLLFFGPLFAYVTHVLELDSATRGLDSGGTGRFELWARGADAILDMNAAMLIGGGFRSANPDYIGFSTESSYVTLTLEFGLVGALLLLSQLWRWLQPACGAGQDLFFVRWLILFMLLESVVNRYLIAVGNPISLMFLMVLMAGEVELAARGGRRARAVDALGGRRFNRLRFEAERGTSGG
jgi:exopolysaccharide production protein ExoQ